jgi:hypothetical protein
MKRVMAREVYCLCAALLKWYTIDISQSQYHRTIPNDIKITKHITITE